MLFLDFRISYKIIQHSVIAIISFLVLFEFRERKCCRGVQVLPVSLTKYGW